MDYTLSIAGLFFTICGDLKDAEYFASHAGMRGSPNLQRPDPSMMLRRGFGQTGKSSRRIFPSAAPLLPSPVPAAPSSAYLDSDGAPHEGDQPLMISASRSNPLAVPSFAKAGFLFRRLSIKR